MYQVHLQLSQKLKTKQKYLLLFQPLIANIALGSNFFLMCYVPRINRFLCKNAIYVFFMGAPQISWIFQQRRQIFGLTRLVQYCSTVNTKSRG
jgi:hypothetical protein